MCSPRLCPSKTVRVVCSQITRTIPLCNGWESKEVVCNSMHFHYSENAWKPSIVADLACSFREFLCKKNAQQRMQRAYNAILNKNDIHWMIPSSRIIHSCRTQCKSNFTYAVKYNKYKWYVEFSPKIFMHLYICRKSQRHHIFAIIYSAKKIWSQFFLNMKKKITKNHFLRDFEALYLKNLM